MFVASLTLEAIVKAENIEVIRRRSECRISKKWHETYNMTVENIQAALGNLDDLKAILKLKKQFNF